MEPSGAGVRPGGAPTVRAVVLGVAQDGGVPHLGCRCVRCEAARAEPGLRRHAASLAVVDEASGFVALVDVGPDVREQIDILGRAVPAAVREGCPVDAVLLTHAHMGHYLGLAHFGREGLAVRGLPAYGSAEMMAFLGAYPPSKLLVDAGGLVPNVCVPGASVALTPHLRVTPIVVPHRRELTDTVAYAIDGPSRRVLYLPDIDGWDGWMPGGRTPADLLATFDVALIDGTFYGDGELPGRDPRDIPHPRISDSLRRFGQGRAGACRVLFTHLNHTNPAHAETSPERRAIEASGLGVAWEGQILDL